MLDYHNHTMLITGAAHGIGRSLAVHFAKHQAEVILLDRDQAGLDAVYDLIMRENPAHTPIQLCCDLNTLNDEIAQNIATQTLETCRKLDVLIHNAAILGPITQLAQYPADSWQQVLQVNFTSQWLLTKALLPCLRLAAHPRVISTTDAVARTPKAHWGAYAISKSATETLIRIWQQELAHLPNFRFYGIDPGAVSTLMRAEAFPAEDPTHLTAAGSILPHYDYLISEQCPDPSGSILSL